jgi:hypothetical protein
MNNLLTRTLLVGALSLCSLSAIANEKGNGGNAVVCFEDQNIVQKLTKDDNLVVKYIPENYLNSIVSIEALDLYKAKLSSGMHNYKYGEVIDLEIDEDVSKYGGRVLSKFKELYPGLIKAYSFGKKLIDRRIVEDFAPLVKVEDMRPISRVSEKCVVTTIMRQDWLPGSNSKKLSIDMRIFSHENHSDLSKAVFFYMNIFIHLVLL